MEGPQSSNEFPNVNSNRPWQHDDITDEVTAEKKNNIKIHDGSIRGVNTLVKDRINLFSSDVLCGESYQRQNANDDETKSTSSGCNKIVVYTTSLGFVRKTKSDCLQVKKILRCLMLRAEERDIFDQQYRKEYDTRFKGLTPPQVIICNKHIGGAPELEQMVETGQIFELTKGIEKVSYFKYPCRNCAGHGYTNCSICLGSCRSKTFRIGSTRELNYLKCTVCKEGLIRCIDCLDVIY